MSDDLVSFRRPAFIMAQTAILFVGSLWSSGLLITAAIAPERVGAKVVGVLAFLPFAWYFGRATRRAARVGMWANADGVFIRNMAAQHLIRWAEVESIEPPGGYNSPMRFLLHDGRTVHAEVFTPGPFSGADFGYAEVQTLRALHRHATADEDSADEDAHPRP